MKKKRNGRKKRKRTLAKHQNLHKEQRLLISGLCPEGDSFLIDELIRQSNLWILSEAMKRILARVSETKLVLVRKTTLFRTANNPRHPSTDFKSPFEELR
jgi:hypothetical protein